jgi:hypothetical protein
MEAIMAVPALARCAILIIWAVRILGTRRELMSAEVFSVLQSGAMGLSGLLTEGPEERLLQRGRSPGA